MATHSSFLLVVIKLIDFKLVLELDIAFEAPKATQLAVFLVL